jgi:hypothetical protein
MSARIPSAFAFACGAHYRETLANGALHITIDYLGSFYRVELRYWGIGTVLPVLVIETRQKKTLPSILRELRERGTTHLESLA